MNTKKKTIKSILCCTTAGAALAMSGYAALSLNKPNYQTYAIGVGSIPVSITNSNFDNDKKTSYPYNPTSFSAYNQGKKVDSSSNSKANINAGVINLSNEKYESKFSLAKRTSLDDYVLMIDSSKEEDDGSISLHEANYGFQTNSTFKLEADSKYMVSVDVFTATDANIASLYLFDNAGNIFSSIKNINSYNTWTPYSFFVSTNSASAVDVKLGMYLEGAGTVLFDNISAQKLSASEYELSKKTANTGEFVETNKVDNIVETYNINNLGQFVNTNDNSIYSNLTEINYEFNKNSSLTTVADSDGKNAKALLLENIDKTYAEYETKENLLTFNQNTIYKVSVNVKTKNLDGTASLKLVRTDIDEDDEDYSQDHNKTIKITSNTYSSTDKSVTNDYKTYSFLINSHSSQSVSYKLVFGLGQDSSTASTGKMYVSQIEVSKINYETYSSATTGSGTEKIDFVSAYKDSKIQLDNGDFNAFKIADYNAPMPATPASWEVTKGTNTQKYGVVNTSKSSFDELSKSFSNLRNPYSSYEKNQNVLMMYNATADTLSYTSTKKSLTAKSYHKFEISVQTQNAPLTLSLVTKKDDKEVVLSSKTVETNSIWQDVTMYLYTGYQNMDVSLKLTLTSTDYAYAYVDDAKFDYILTAAQLENEFKSASNSTYTCVADLTNLFDKNSQENFSTSTLFETEKVSGVQTGLIALNSTHLDEVIYDPNDLESFNTLGGNVFGIRSTNDVFYTAKTNVGFKLTTGTDKYYKISVSVYTQNLGSNDAKIDSNLLGASIKLTGFEDKFTSIQSNNGWSTYTFYVQPSSDTTTYLELSLGSSETHTKGDAFFGNIEFADDVTAEEYNSAKTSANTIVVKNTSSKTDNEETNKESESKKGLGSSWIYLIPSLLTAAAIIIAVVGLIVRKVKFKKPVKKTKTSYDRNKTVSVQYYTRKATTMREEKIRELTSDLEKINAERKKFEDDYKHDLTKLREMKIKRANPQEIAKLEKDLKKNQKLSANLGVTANKISDELSYTKTDAYLNALVKKLSREPAQNNKPEDQDK